MTGRILTLRELNRATLSRQLLLERQSISAEEGVAQVMGLQSQIPNPPYIGLWSRLSDFKRDDLTQAMADARIVRAPWLRSTLHLITAEDHRRFHHVIRPALEKGLRSFFGKRIVDLEYAPLLQAAEAFLSEPASMGQIEEHLLPLAPDRDPAALGYIVRTFLPVVQTPPGGTWGKGSFASYTTADRWITSEVEPADLRTFFRRYLAAFGPASLMDFQTWSGLNSLKALTDELTEGLILYRDERGKTLYDLPDMPHILADTPAPVRFLPEYDNLLIAQADRTRVLSDEDRTRVFLTAGRVLNTILVDGFVAGTWKMDVTRRAATLAIAPFRPLSDDIRAALMAEGEPLIRFVAPQCETFTATFVS